MLTLKDLPAQSDALANQYEHNLPACERAPAQIRWPHGEDCKASSFSSKVLEIFITQNIS